jgi:lipoic acid synthetase
MREKPSWIRTKAYPVNNTNVKRGINLLKLNTICWQGACPNRFECWNRDEAAFLIGGDICTRNCSFCNVKSGRPKKYDVYEPKRLAQMIKTLQLKYVTVTGVERDDLPDKGAWLYAETVRAIRRSCNGIKIELLVPDFRGVDKALSYVMETRPEVMAHNIETVRRVFKKIRRAFDYDLSLEILRRMSEVGIAKSNIMLGLGETDEEVYQLMQEIYDTGCRLLTITQYLPPSDKHMEVSRWVKPETFKLWQERAQKIGYWAVFSGPLVRSSYRAHEMYEIALKNIKATRDVSN